MIRVSDGKNNLEFDKNLVSGHIANFVLDIDENNLKELGINAKKEKYMEALVALNEVVEGLTEDKLKEILDHLLQIRTAVLKNHYKIRPVLITICFKSFHFFHAFIDCSATLSRIRAIPM